MKPTTINREHKKELAGLFNVSEDYVAKVINGKRHNKAITDAYELLTKASEKATVVTRVKISKKLMKG